MTGTRSELPQGPFEGSRCLAAPGGRRWGPATIRRVNEDGSFKVEFDDKEGFIALPYWYGITPAEVSFDDARQWSAVFDQICGEGRSFAAVDLSNALAALGYQIAPDRAWHHWVQSCQTLFNVSEKQAESHILDETSAYRLFLHLKLSAKECAQHLRADRPKPFFKLYWNHIRMGGREPDEVPRQVTLEDALAALGLKADRVDHSAAAFLRRVEQEHGVRLPSTLTTLLQCQGVVQAITDCHPNDPSLIDFSRGQWNIRGGMRDQQLSGDYALVIMVPHQGDHEWAVVFDDGEDDAQVYVRWGAEDGGTWSLTAPNIGMFFWDLAQTGLAWYQDTRYKGGKSVLRSDIGLVLDS